MASTRPWILLALSACTPVLDGPAPELDALTPSLVCNDQLVTDVVVAGEALSPVVTSAFTDDAAVVLPQLTLQRVATLTGEDEAGPERPLDDAEVGGRVRWESQQSMVFTVDAGLDLPQGIWSLHALSLDGDEAEVAQALAVVPPPVLATVDPQIVCVSQADQTLTLAGEGFLLVDGELPVVELGGVELTADALDDCFDIVADNVSEAARSCRSLTFTIPQDGLAPAVYDLVVRNPAPAGCASTETVQLEIVPEPTLDVLVPQLACNAQVDDVYAATGTGFLDLDGALPTVALGDAWSATADSVSSCTDLAGPAGGRTCTSATFTVPEGEVDPGIYRVSITNPAPADCVTEEPVDVEVVPPPTVTGLSVASVCVDAPTTPVTVEGTDFLRLADGTLPGVTLGGVAVPVVGAAGCVDLLGPAGGAACTTLDVELPTGTFTMPQSVAVVVANPAPADCVSNDDITLDITPPPVITDVQPAVVCSTGGSITITGTDFQPDAEVLVGGVPATGVVWVSHTELQADLAQSLPGGFLDVTVRHPDGCEDTASGAVEVVAGPVLFFVDPPTVFSELNTLATLFVGGVTGDVTSVELEGPSGQTVAVTTFAWDGGNTVSALIPSGLEDGAWTVRLSDVTQCTPFLEDAFDVVSTPTVSVGSIQPAWGWNDAPTPVAVLDEDPAPAGADAFVDLPRIYLNPVNAGPTDVATSLRTVAFRDPGQLDAVVPTGLASGGVDRAYDVIVINPDGTIGVLRGGFTATVEPPPVVDSASPSRLTANTLSTVLLQGTDFRSPTVSTVCTSPLGALTTTDWTVSSSDASSITFDMNPGDEGSLCIVVVRNDDGSAFPYSAVTARSASGNLFGFRASVDLSTARRAPGATTGRATEAARYLYVVGGDDGAGTIYGSVERFAIGVDTELGPSVSLPLGIPGGRTDAGLVTAGRFLYLVGGQDVSGPRDDILRAQILDPLAAPALDDLTIAFGTGTELEGGAWTYRISAVFPAGDPSNPGGESMASDPIVVRLPDLSDRLRLSLQWTAVSGASGYRVYRSPAPDLGSGSEELLAEVSGTTYTDLGGSTDANEVPLPSGALGAWHEVGMLPGTDATDAARVAPCVTVARDPAVDGAYHVYVGGGLDGLGVPRASVSGFSVFDQVGGGQAVGTPVGSGYTLATARSHCGAATVDDRFHTVVGPGESWVYFLGGDDGSGAVGKAEAALVQTGGLLTAGTDAAVDDITPGRSGAAVGSAGDFLFLLGGRNGTSGTSGTEGALQTPPTLANWNSLGGSSILFDRLDAVGAQENAVLYIVGGVDGGGAPVSTLELTNF